MRSGFANVRLGTLGSRRFAKIFACPPQLVTTSVLPLDKPLYFQQTGGPPTRTDIFRPRNLGIPAHRQPEAAMAPDPHRPPPNDHRHSRPVLFLRKQVRGSRKGTGPPPLPAPPSPHPQRAFFSFILHLLKFPLAPEPARCRLPG